MALCTQKVPTDLFICEWISLIQNTFISQIMVVIKVNLLSENVGQDGRTVLKDVSFGLFPL